MSNLIKSYPVQKGIHLYINLNNFEELVESKQDSGSIANFFKQMNRYFATIETFVLNYAKQGAEIEKITSSRLHLVFSNVDRSTLATTFIDIVNFAYQLSKKQDLFTVGMGADYGYFTGFDFIHNSYQEYTSIGFPANRAAKLQSRAGNGQLYVSKELVDVVGIKSIKFKVSNKDIQDAIRTKYRNIEVYELDLSQLNEFVQPNQYRSFETIAMQRYTDYTQKDILIEKITESKINFESLSTDKVISAIGSVLYIDIRGFTKMFNQDGSNLNTMAKLTKTALITMYDSISKYQCNHIQFQGDRESATNTKYEKDKMTLYSLQSAMLVLDEIGKLNNNPEMKDIKVGIGITVGRFYATKVGVRGNKDNIIVGRVVNQADTAEDEVALGGEIAVSEDFYVSLKKTLNTKVLQTLFTRRNEYYVTSHGLKQYQLIIDEHTQDNNTVKAKEHNYTKPWSL